MTAYARDENALRLLLDRHLLKVDALSYLGEGQDNIAYATDDLVVRVAKAPGADDAIRRDADLLTAVAALLDDGGVRIAVPTPVVVDAEAGLLVYRKVRGRTLLATRFGNTHPSDPDRGHVDDAALASALGELLTVLHNASAAEFGALAGVDDESTEVWLAETDANYRTISSLLTAPQRHAVESFLDTEPPTTEGPLVFSHNDLGAEHLLIDPETGALTGVIDWTDAALTDRTKDFAKLFRDLGPTVHDAVLDHYLGPYQPGDHERILFFARCALIVDAAYGIETDTPEYVRAAMANFSHTFAPLAPQA